MKLARLNTGLLILIVAVNLYTIGAPLIPRLDFWWQSRSSDKGRQLEHKAWAAPTKPKAPVASATISREVIIPSMLLDQPILEGPQRDMYRILDRGIWHWPLSSTPDKGGNTVLLGHRFTYTNPRGVLYFLNKVGVGDTIGITWDYAQYIYKVTQVRTVPPTDTSVTAPTAKPTLTVYTCTPLWRPHDRLVVTAELEKKL